MIFPAIALMNPQNIGFMMFLTAWLYATFWVLPALHLYLLVRSFWALSADVRGRVAVAGFAIALPFTAAGLLPGFVARLVSLSGHDFMPPFFSSLIGVAIVQLSLSLMLSSGRCTNRTGVAMDASLACAIVAAVQLVGGAGMLQTGGLSEKSALCLITIPLAVQIALLYVSRYQLKSGSYDLSVFGCRRLLEHRSLTRWTILATGWGVVLMAFALAPAPKPELHLYLLWAGDTVSGGMVAPLPGLFLLISPLLLAYPGKADGWYVRTLIACPLLLSWLFASDITALPWIVACTLAALAICIPHGPEALVERQGITLLNNAAILSVPLVAVGVHPDGRGYMVTRDLVGMLPADKILATEPHHATRIADLAWHLHRAHLHHRDLYLCHFMLRPGDPYSPIHLIDAGRVARMPVRPLHLKWIIKDVSQLLYSVEDAPLPESIGEAILNRYLEGAGRIKRALLQATISQKVASIRRHDMSNRRKRPGRRVSIDSLVDQK